MILLLACSGPAPVVAADRSAHLFDRPFPSDELLVDGLVDLSGFPEAGTDLGATMVGGWAAQASATVHGFSHFSAVYFRTTAPVEVAPSYAGLPGDPLRLIDLDTGEQVPVEARFFGDTGGDPFIPSNTIAFAPAPTAPLRSGHRYLAMVSTALLEPLDDLPAEAPEDAAVATIFTVQDSQGQLVALREATDAWLDEHIDALTPTGLKKVSSIRYEQGLTASGNEATVCTVTFADGSSEQTFLGPQPEVEAFTLDLSADPMEVWQATIQTPNFQGLTDRPYSAPGIGLLADFSRIDSGWIDFDASGALTSVPESEPMRVVIQVPRDKAAGLAAMTWDHGTGGHAYNAVQGYNPASRGDLMRASWAEAGVVVVSRDQPLYGTRYPLIDEGFGFSIGFYNIGNLPAFRDNQRQAAVDHRVLDRFTREVVPWLVPEGSIDPERRLGAFGHSLGSVTTHLGLAMAEGSGAEAVQVSGTGGYFTYYVLDTGLLDTDNDVVGMIGPLLGGDLPEDPTVEELLAALVGAPDPALIDRFHPSLQVFQLIMDPSDPLALAPEQVVHEEILRGEGDLQVPNTTTDWLARILYPNVNVVWCTPTSADYDPHACQFRETVGLDAIADFAAGL